CMRPVSLLRFLFVSVLVYKNCNCFREYLEGRLDAETEESDYDLDEEYRDQTLRGRQKYLLNEVKCLETTLAKRRAELRQSDRLLAECQSDLAAARDEVF
ncbi:unnamed protein product, partial [Owenia fusiformis]